MSYSSYCSYHIVLERYDLSSFCEDIYILSSLTSNLKDFDQKSKVTSSDHFLCWSNRFQPVHTHSFSSSHQREKILEIPSTFWNDWAAYFVKALADWFSPDLLNAANWQVCRVVFARTAPLSWRQLERQPPPLLFSPPQPWFPLTLFGGGSGPHGGPHYKVDPGPRPGPCKPRPPTGSPEPDPACWGSAGKLRKFDISLIGRCRGRPVSGNSRWLDSKLGGQNLRGGGIKVAR